MDEKITGGFYKSEIIAQTPSTLHAPPETYGELNFNVAQYILNLIKTKQLKNTLLELVFFTIDKQSALSAALPPVYVEYGEARGRRKRVYLHVDKQTWTRALFGDTGATNVLAYQIAHIILYDHIPISV